MTAALLGYRDLQQARKFFVATLGFVEELTVHGDQGGLSRVHVAVRRHGVMSPQEAGGVTHLILITGGAVDAHSITCG